MTTTTTTTMTAAAVAASNSNNHRTNNRTRAAARFPMSPGLMEASETSLLDDPRHQHTSNNNTCNKKLERHSERWQHQSELAGPHSQNEHYLKIDRPLSHQAFRGGILPQVAARIQVLDIHCECDSLPAWLDILASLYFALQHLTIYDKKKGRDTTRMKRLYILYRLPDLISIDGIVVTEEERQLARPNTPNGQRVQRKDWVQDRILQTKDSEDAICDDGGEVEVGLYGVVKRIHADPPEETWDEPAWEKPFQPREYPTSSPPLLAEISDDSKSPTRRDAPILGFSLCTRNEKYFPMEEESYEIQNPSRRDMTRRKLPSPKSPPAIYSTIQQPTLTTPPKRIVLFQDTSIRTGLSSPVVTPRRNKCSPTASPSLTSPFPIQFRSKPSSPAERLKQDVQLDLRRRRVTERWKNRIHLRSTPILDTAEDNDGPFHKY